MTRRQAAATLFLLSAALGAGIAQAAGGGVLVDGRGNPVRTSAGECIPIPGETVTDARCLPETAPRPGDGELAVTVPAPSAQPAYVYETATLAFRSRQPFRLNGAGLSPEMRQNLLAFLVSLEDYFQVTRLEVTGHADATGSTHYNQWLSEKRAESVQIYFRSLGVDPRILLIRGAGESEPLPALPPAAAAQRRVEITAEVRIRKPAGE